jgi:pimeloyl-ACP methyl ester carboxylesterase
MKPYTTHNQIHDNPVILIPGILFGLGSWGDFKHQLMEKFWWTIEYTLPGYDGRPELEEELTPELLAWDLKEWLALRHIMEPVHLVAHCSGCHTALTFAKLFPEWVKTITLIGYWDEAKGWESRKELVEMGAEAYANVRCPKLLMPNPRPILLDFIKLITIKGCQNPNAVLNVARLLDKYNMKETLLADKHTKCFVVGAKDAVTLPAAQVRRAEQCGAKLIYLENVGHCPAHEVPLALSSALDKFFKDN